MEVETMAANAEVEETGSITVPMKEFSDIIKNLSDDKEINLYSDENNKFHIKSGKSKFWVMGTPKSEYPAIPEVERNNSMSLDPVLLQQMIEKTALQAVMSYQRRHHYRIMSGPSGTSRRDSRQGRIRFRLCAER